MTHKPFWDFEIQTDHLITARRPDLIIVKKKKKTHKKKNKEKKEKTCRIVDFAIPLDYKVKIKESDKYLDLARELKKQQQLWNMKVTVMPIVSGSLGTIP